ncbi:hypothetical protein WJX72_006192 [[Myrmecia] bisecta]|uniref:Uncharacterized protein n=1 Tax=[Myrmecia] bisecta TaxID=41462 RepID=A0AAW1QFC7_9CHLO
MQSLELACQTAISKRRTRGPAVPAPLQRFGEWYQGDDTELDETLMEYNDAHGSPGGGRRQERNRRKSAFPTFTSRMAETDADGIEAEAEVEQAAARRGPKATRQRRSTLAPGQELMRQADQLLPGEAPEKKRGRAKAQADEAQPLRVRLQQAWHGKSYYERLRDMADGEARRAQGRPPRARTCPVPQEHWRQSWQSSEAS